MRLITLNTWSGRRHDALADFIRREARTTDIFCFQEIFRSATGKTEKWKDCAYELYADISKLIPDYIGYYHTHFRDYYGLATFVRPPRIPVFADEIFVHKFKEFEPGEEEGFHARNIQITTYDEPKQFSVVNFHGLWNGQGKGDSPDRLEQSRKIVEGLKTAKGEVILCGDFNLEPYTESMAILEASGLRNLVKEYGITGTRTRLYQKPGKFADYILISKRIKVNEFRVLTDEVSDHAPLMLDFDV